MRLIPIALFAMAWIAAAPSSAQPVGEVIAQRGAVTAFRDGRPRVLVVGDAIEAHDELFTGADARIKVRFDDGTVVALGAEGRLIVTEYVLDAEARRQSTLLRLVQGILRATVGLFSAVAPFGISTETATASVRGTDWIMEAGPGATAAVVLDGTVAVRSELGPEVTLEAGEGTDVRAGQAPSPAVTWGAARVEGFVDRTTVP